MGAVRGWAARENQNQKFSAHSQPEWAFLFSTGAQDHADQNDARGGTRTDGSGLRADSRVRFDAGLDTDGRAGHYRRRWRGGHRLPQPDARSPSARGAPSAAYRDLQARPPPAAPPLVVDPPGRT